MSKILFGENFEQDTEDIVYYSVDGKKSTRTHKEYYESILSDVVAPSTYILYLFFDIMS